MRKNLCIGILRETKETERRAPITPQDVAWFVKRKVKIEVESNPKRIFRDIEYKKAGAKIVKNFKNATLLLGIKPPAVANIYPNCVYMVFSHTAKGQIDNMPFLEACLADNITLLDYEKIVDQHGERLVYFGRFAGICGLVDSLHYLGKKLELKGTKTPLTLIKPAHTYGSLESLKQAMARVDKKIRKKGFDKSLSPFIVGITGHGQVSKGVQEILGLLGPIEVHPKDMLQFIKYQKGKRQNVYKIVFLREEKFRAKNKRGFYFEEYLKDPAGFESNLDVYLPYINILIHTSYWDTSYPRMVTKRMIDRLSRKKPFRLQFIGDISCDINGSIELTYKATTSDNPTFTYDPKSKEYTDGYAPDGITVLAVDNLPSELPRDASQEFGDLIRDYVYQIAAHGVRDITRHAALPAEIRKAVVAENRKLTKDFRYLTKWVIQKSALPF